MQHICRRHFATLVFLVSTVVSVHAQDVCYYKGDKFSNGAKHQPSISTPSAEAKQSKKKAKADLTCSKTGAFSDGAYYSDDGQACQKCVIDTWLRDQNPDHCKQPQTCVASSWLDN
jgi:hypothetical protein